MVYSYFPYFLQYERLITNTLKWWVFDGLTLWLGLELIFIFAFLSSTSCLFNIIYSFTSNYWENCLNILIQVNSIFHTNSTLSLDSLLLLNIFWQHIVNYCFTKKTKKMKSIIFLLKHTQMKICVLFTENPENVIMAEAVPDIFIKYHKNSKTQQIWNFNMFCCHSS